MRVAQVKAALAGRQSPDFKEADARAQAARSAAQGEQGVSFSLRRGRAACWVPSPHSALPTNPPPTTLAPRRALDGPGRGVAARAARGAGGAGSPGRARRAGACLAWCQLAWVGSWPGGGLRWGVRPPPYACQLALLQAELEKKRAARSAAQGGRWLD